jgi:two-component system phosphate regulon sensor histidine kinase PhoR
MRRAILIFSCVLAGISVILTAALIHAYVYRGFAERMRQELRAEADYIARAVESLGEEYLSGLPRDMTKPRVTLVSPGGDVLYDTLRGAEEMGNHLDRPEIAGAISDGFGEITRFSDTLSEITYYCAVRLSDGSVLRVAGTSGSALAALPGLTVITLCIVTAVIAVSAAVSARVTRRLVRPINALDLEAPEENVIYEELSPLLTRIREQNSEIDAQIERIREKQAEFSAITENMREGLIVIDGDARVLSHNRAAAALLRISGHFPENGGALTIRRDGPFRRLVADALSGKGSEVTLRAGEGVVQLYANPVGEGQDIRGAVITLLDVTEREDRERMRREFSANVSHELKTPITVISGYAEILANGVARPEDTREFAGKIYTEAQRLIALVEDIMLISRLDEGGAEFPRDSVELYSLVTDVASRFEQRARDRSVAVKVSGDRVRLTGSRRALDEMVSNLIDNAIKYNADGGSVAVSVMDGGGGAVLTVSDTGHGIAPEECERVFERFYRTDGGRELAAGTGLGLSIVKHAAQLHGAAIKLDSREGEGMSVRITFPPSR